nr:hypothetical protein [Bacillus licheniformis]
MRRILYFDGILFWFFGVFKMVYILAPLMFLLFGIHSLKTDLWSITSFWSPAFLGSYLSFKAVSDRRPQYELEPYLRYIDGAAHGDIGLVGIHFQKAV